MRLTRTAILNMANKEAYKFSIKRADTKDSTYLIGIRDTAGQIYFDDVGKDKLAARIKVSGQMICPCAMSLEEVDVPYSLQEEVFFSLSDIIEDGEYALLDELDVEEFILDLVLPSAPIKVVKEGKIEYHSGDGWCVLSEDMLLKMKRAQIDPRLAKLKEYKFDEKE